MERLLKYCLFLSFLLSNGILINSQRLNEQYVKYAQRVTDFKLEDYAFAIHEIEGGNYSEIDIKNSIGSVLRFKVDRSGNLHRYYSALVFIHYEFKNEWIAKITTYGENGKIKGAIAFEDYAITEFIVKKPTELVAKFKIVDEKEGNIDMKDVAEELVLKRELNSKNELIREYYITSDDYWDMQHMQFRP